MKFSLKNCNFKKYDVVITTSYETKHGISGHLFEMVEYFYHLNFHKNIKSCILISDGTTEEEFFGSVNDKYEFTKEEYAILKDNTFFIYHPKIIICNTILIVDGSFRFKNCDIFCNKKIVFRCKENEDLSKADIVLQDNEIYNSLPNSIHYKKKILFSKFKKIESTVVDCAMLYATTNSRELSYNDLENISRLNYNNYVVLSNKQINVPEKFRIINVPAKNLFSLFNIYLYTKTTTHIDCSPRFVAECKFYDKKVKYLTVIDKGLEVRIKDLEKGIVELNENDDIYSKIQYNTIKD